MKNSLQMLAWCLIIVGGLICIYFILSISVDGYWIWGKSKTDFSITGEIGDFMGGVVGTVFALAGTLLIFLTFDEQTKQNKREAFEAAFFEMVHLHRENVSELKYTKYDG